MSNINTFLELKDAVADYLNRTDLSSQIHIFAGLTEKRIFRKLRTQANEVMAILRPSVTTLVDPTTGLDVPVQIPPNMPMIIPKDMLEMRTFFCDGAPLEVVSPEEMQRWRLGSRRVGRPTHYARIGGYFQFYPIPSTEPVFPEDSPDGIYTYQMNYYNDQSGLDADEDSSEVLITMNELYLYGTLAEAYRFIKSPQDAEYWDQEFEKALFEANEHARQTDLAGRPIAIGSGYQANDSLGSDYG